MFNSTYEREPICQNYVVCKNCGKYVNYNKHSIDGYCSDECRKKYRRCPNCGKYFPFKIEQIFCTKDCAKVLEDEIFEKYKVAGKDLLILKSFV